MLARAIDAADHSKGTVFIMEDITEREAAQDALLRARDDLELRVQERTAELAVANARLQREIQERKQAQELASHLANHDALTGLPNRRWLEDRFKPINDSLGHRIGDLLLQSVAQRLRGLLREDDTVSRIGGDEFVVVLQNIRSDAATNEIARKVLGTLSQPYPIEGHTLSVTPSIGISRYPQDAADAETLISRADDAMYQAKRQGRANARFFAPDTAPPR